MATDTQLFIDIQTNLLKSLENSQKTLDKIGDILTENQKKFDGVDKTTEKITDSYNDITKKQKEWNGGLDIAGKTVQKIAGVFKSMFGVVAGIFGVLSFAGAFKDAARFNEEVLDISFRMGHAGRSVGALTAAMDKTVQTTGLAGDQAKELVKGLALLRVPVKDIGDLSVAAARFHKITGASVQTVARLTGELSRTGRMGVSSITGILGTMASMQRAVGLTEGEMEQLSETTIMTTKILRQMGKNAAEIEKFAKGTTVLAAAFSSVGIEASDALKFVEKLLDPAQIEDNAFMLSKLGISMDDAFSGNIDPGAMAKQFKELGAELKAMSGPAAAEMAKSLGMPLDTLRQMGDMDLGKLEAALAETGGDYQAAMAKMQGEQTGPQEALENSINKMQNMIEQVMREFLPVMKIIADVLDNLMKFVKPFIEGLKTGIHFLVSGLTAVFGMFKNPVALILFGVIIFKLITSIKRKFFQTNTEIAEHLSTSMTKAIQMGTQKGEEIAAAKGSDFTAKWAEDRKRRIIETYDFQKMQSKGEYLEALASSNTYFKNSILWAAKLNKEGSYGVKSKSFLLSIEDSLNKKAFERYKSAELEGRQMLGMKAGLLEMARFEESRLNTRKNELLALKENGKISIDQLSELNGLQRASEKIGREATKLENDLEKDRFKREQQRESLLKNITANSLQGLYKEVDLQKQRIVEQQKENDTRVNAIKLEQVANDMVKKSMQAEEQKLLLKGKQKTLTADEALQLQKVTAELRKSEALEISLNNEMDERKRDAAAFNAQLKDVNAQLDKMDKKKIDLADPNAMKEMKNVFLRMKDVGLSFKNNLVSGAKELGIKMKNSVDNFKEGFVGALKAAPGYLRQLGGNGPLGLVKGIGVAMTTKEVTRDDGTKVREKNALGKGVGAIGGLLGPLALITGFLSRSKGFQDMMSKIMTALQKPINALFGAIMPLIDPLIGLIEVVFKNIIVPILKAIAPPLLKFMAFALTLLGWIAKGIGKLTGIKGMVDVGDSLISVAKQINVAADGFSSSFDKSLAATEANTDATQGNTDAQDGGPVVYNATGAGLMSGAASAAAQQDAARQQALQQQQVAATQAAAQSTRDLGSKQDKAVAAQDVTAQVLMEVRDYIKKLLDVTTDTAQQAYLTGGRK